MKKGTVVFFFILFVSAQLCAQNTKELNANGQIPANGIQLESNWRFRAGDNVEWMQPDFDDRNWQVINLDQLMHNLKISKSDIGWLRYNFKIDPSHNDSMFAFLINQFGASEIYVDGHLVKRIGNINSSGVTAFNPHNTPIPTYLNKASGHIIAIRFAGLPLSKWISNRLNTPPLSVRLQPLSSALSEQEKELKASRFRTGIAFVNGVFGLLFLMLFLFYPQQRLHLYLSLFNISLVLIFFVTQFLQEGQYSLTGHVYLSYGYGLLSRLIGLNILIFMLLALDRMKPFFWWFIAFVLFIDFPLSIVLPVQFQFINFLVRLCFIIICIWVVFQTFQTKRKEDWLIGLMAFSVVFMNLSFMLLILTGIDITPLASMLVAFLSTVFTVIFVAWRYASANTSLQQQLIYVKKLSDENLHQEKEKQQILAKQNETLEAQVKQRTTEITFQKEALQNNLEKLKQTQSQLIQSEKMASLGELTAGIAHEIQNPLNFVNNFSDVNTELIDELQNELKSGNTEEAISISNDIKENEQKINHHGKRADAIVKGMLQHSRSSSGVKEPTDINALCDEYLRLSYHGLRAKDKSFNATLKTNFDNSIGNINIIPQDVGRVILNLLTNAFYVVNEKKKQQPEGYEPLVSVTTKKIGNKMEIEIRDNGNGIPQKVLDKIFQPFFTTKPTGEGTGLGLSLSYDIIKALGGEIKVETKEGEGSAFK